MATADLSVLVLGRAQVGTSDYIAEIQRRLQRQDRVRFRMHAMATSREGSTADILAVVAELHAVPFEEGAPRVYTVLKLDERHDRPGQTLDDKIRAVEDRLGGGIAGGHRVPASGGLGYVPQRASHRRGRIEQRIVILRQPARRFERVQPVTQLAEPARVARELAGERPIVGLAGVPDAFPDVVAEYDE